MGTILEVKKDYLPLSDRKVAMLRFQLDAWHPMFAVGLNCNMEEVFTPTSVAYALRALADWIDEIYPSPKG